MVRTRRQLLRSGSFGAVLGFSGCLRLVTGESDSTEPTSTESIPATTRTTQEEVSTVENEQTSESTEESTPAAIVAVDAASGQIESVNQKMASGEVKWIDRLGEAIVYGAHPGPSVGLIEQPGEEPRWTQNLDTEGLYGLNATDDLVHICGDRTAYVLDAGSGDIVDEFDHDPSFRGFVGQNDISYVFGEDGTATAFDVSKTESIWERSLTHPSNTLPAIKDDTIYYGSESGFVVAISSTTGETEWESRVGGTLRQPLSVTEKYVWVIDKSTGLYAFERATGNRVLQFDDGLNEHQRYVQAVDDIVCTGVGGTPVPYRFSSDGDSIELTRAWEFPNFGVPSVTTESHFVLGGPRLTKVTPDGEVALKSPTLENHWFSTNHGRSIEKVNQRYFVAAKP